MYIETAKTARGLELSFTRLSVVIFLCDCVAGLAKSPKLLWDFDFFVGYYKHCKAVVSCLRRPIDGVAIYIDTSYQWKLQRAPVSQRGVCVCVFKDFFR